MNQPRETEYKGDTYRSRLEAKWAAWFTAWGTPFQYEPERYGRGKRGYLPDFWLPSLGLFWEIKPACRFMDPTPDIRRAIEATAHMPAPLWIVYGEPLPQRYVIEDRVGSSLVLAQCRKCHGLSFMFAEGYDVASIWQNAASGEWWGWGQIGPHTCKDHDRAPMMDETTALAAAYRNGQKIWRWF